MNQPVKIHKGRVTKCPVQNKVKFFNRKHAEKHADDNGYVARAYYCKECDYFHLTSKAQGTGKVLTISPRKKRNKPRRLL